MTHLKKNYISQALLLSLFGGSAFMLSACNAVNDAWNFIYDDSGDQLRTPTGFYEHANAQEYQDPLSVPSDLAEPYVDHSIDVPYVNISEQSRTMVGERMDVRPPVVSQVNDLGLEVLEQNGDAVVWFLPYNSFNIHSVDDAWTMLNYALNFLKIPAAESDASNYTIVTGAADYTISGTPYDRASEDLDADRYRQVYKVNVGTTPQGLVGLYVNLQSSSTNAANNSMNLRQQQSFTVGFANSLMRGLERQQNQEDVIPDQVNVFLGRDNNDQDALIVNAPYQATWNVMRGVLSQYGFVVDEYSVSRSSFKVSYDEKDPSFYRNQGLEPFNIEEAEYLFRLAVSGEQTLITIYDKDDHPLKSQVVAALYPGLSQAIAQEFAIYRQQGSNYLAKFSKED